ncbi:MAG: ABC transporter substrate-binding protein [bacterium]|nr:ABC transporter substrate-binding protein [bacterium]
MKLKKLIAISMASVLTIAMIGCGNSNQGTEGAEAAAETEAPAAEEAAETEQTAEAAQAPTEGELKYTDITLGEDYTDLTATIKVLNHRTDMGSSDYPGKNWEAYIADFNQMYPNITVDLEVLSNYADDGLLRLQDADWGDVMEIPAVDKADLNEYYLPLGTLEDITTQANMCQEWSYEGIAYGVPTTAAAQGIVYNKKVFEAAGVQTLPKTPDEFITALKAIKEKTDAIPLYTNYAAEWTMGAWDAYIWGSATGNAAYKNHDILHTSNPFADPGDGTHAYNVYKILFDAVEQGLIEEDYSTTDWEGCKGMINNGEIGCMVLGSWSVTQMQSAGDHPDDIGYMPFPITVDGKQYATAGPDFNWGVNINSTPENQAAGMVFIKWMTEQSGFSKNEGGLPIAASDTELPSVYDEFADVTFVSNAVPVEGEFDLLNNLNSESELMLDQEGNKKNMEIIEHAANADMSFDEIMDDWNARWTAAQEESNVEITN